MSESCWTQPDWAGSSLAGPSCFAQATPCKCEKVVTMSCSLFQSRLPHRVPPLSRRRSQVWCMCNVLLPEPEGEGALYLCAMLWRKNEVLTASKDLQQQRTISSSSSQSGNFNIMNTSQRHIFQSCRQSVCEEVIFAEGIRHIMKESRGKGNDAAGDDDVGKIKRRLIIYE